MAIRTKLFSLVLLVSLILFGVTLGGRQVSVRVIRRFRPEILVVSLGLDILRGDPTGTFALAPGVMEDIAARLGQLDLPLLIVQEGGHNLQKIGSATFSRDSIPWVEQAQHGLAIWCHCYQHLKRSLVSFVLRL